MATVTIPMSQALKKELCALAQADHRAFAPWARMHLTKLATRSRAARRATA